MQTDTLDLFGSVLLVRKNMEDYMFGEKCVFSAADFPGGKLVINGLYEQKLPEDPGGIDQLFVKYSNQVGIDVGWEPELDPSGEFYVRLVRLDDERNWETILECKCKTMDGLRFIMKELARIAPQVPAIL